MCKNEESFGKWGSGGISSDLNYLPAICYPINPLPFPAFRNNATPSSNPSNTSGSTPIECEFSSPNSKMEYK
ncbi:unnamed protein product [Periconia digitata]|uniref:Uncharacterized protein n=1 Tax=Periconia digitata TaxID=1303443 RepID=A0A9W4UTI2_9PLEO|nr:unnamed protein product [Periconia digitata]